MQRCRIFHRLRSKYLPQRAVSILIILSLIFQILVFVPNTIQTSKAWWNEAWHYYRTLNINTNGYSGYYQMRINVTYDGSGFSGQNVSCNGHCQSDFDDIRFVDIDNLTVLPYWKETYVDSQYAIFWVNISADAMSDEKILMYYGNPSAEDISNGDETFNYFTDFDTDKSSDFRTVGSATFTWEIDNSRLKGVYTGNSWQMYQLKTSYSRPLTIESKFMQSGLDWHCDGGIGYGKSSTTNIDNYKEIEGYHFNLRSSSHMTLRFTKISGNENYNTNEGTFSANTWYRVTLKIGTSDIYGCVIDDNGNKLEVSHSDITYDNLYPGVSADIDGGTIYWDFFLIRKYADQNPHGATLEVSNHKKILHQMFSIHILQMVLLMLNFNRYAILMLATRKETS